MVTDVVTRVAEAFMANVGRAIVNKEDEVRLCLVTLLCEGWHARWTAPSAASSSRPTCFPPTSPG